MSRKIHSRWAAIAVAVSALGTIGCQKLKARDNLNKGVQYYKASQFDRAIEHFKKAKELDPKLMNARLFLATAYATSYIPGAPSEENLRNGEQALAEFRESLELQADNLSAIDGIGSLLYNMGGNPFDPKMIEESRSFHVKHIQLKPDDPDPYYWVGVIDWTLAYRANNQMRKEYNDTNDKQIKELDPLPAKVREGFAQYYAETVEDGIKHLERAIQRKPDYDSAFAYLNLLYRQKADQVPTPEEREAMLAKADELMGQFQVIRQKKMEEEASRFQ